MKKSTKRNKLYSEFIALNLADKCLLVFMAILMIQSSHNLFFHELNIKDTDSLDVIIRTTASAIFGYFISANFQNGDKNTAVTDENGVNGQFDEVGNSTSENSGFKVQKSLNKHNNIQILIVASIGMFALFMIIIARNFMPINISASATISQLRDFVSGSVGFLMGHSTHKKRTHNNP